MQLIWKKRILKRLIIPKFHKFVIHKFVKGAQMDMLIVRDDRVVNLCEMKYLSKIYEPNAEDEQTFRERIATNYPDWPSVVENLKNR
jgi:hypothetical protein